MVSRPARAVRWCRGRLLWIRHRSNHAADLVLDRSSRLSQRLYYFRSDSGRGRSGGGAIHADAATRLVTAQLGTDQATDSEARLPIFVRMHARADAAQRIVLSALLDDGTGDGQRSDAVPAIETDCGELRLRKDRDV